MTTDTHHIETGWIQTFTGKRFYPLEPRAEDVCIEDIAHALSLQCRFTGHLREFYSVSQHSVFVSELVPDPDALWGLLHDAAEAYLVDLPRPVKQRLRQLHGDPSIFDVAEELILRAVQEKFGLSGAMPGSVKWADTILLVTEARDLMGPLLPGWKHKDGCNGYRALPCTIKPLLPVEAERLFLDRFQELRA